MRRQKRSCKDKGKDWSSAATSHGTAGAGRGKTGIFLNCQKESIPADTFVSDFWLPDCERISFCCLKGPSLG